MVNKHRLTRSKVFNYLDKIAPKNNTTNCFYLSSAAEKKFNDKFTDKHKHIVTLDNNEDERISYIPCVNVDVDADVKSDHISMTFLNNNQAIKTAGIGVDNNSITFFANDSKKSGVIPKGIIGASVSHTTMQLHYDKDDKQLTCKFDNKFSYYITKNSIENNDIWTIEFFNNDTNNAKNHHQAWLRLELNNLASLSKILLEFNGEEITCDLTQTSGTWLEPVINSESLTAYPIHRIAEHKFKILSRQGTDISNDKMKDYTALSKQLFESLPKEDEYCLFTVPSKPMAWYTSNDWKNSVSYVDKVNSYYSSHGNENEITLPENKQVYTDIPLIMRWGNILIIPQLP